MRPIHWLLEVSSSFNDVDKAMPMFGIELSDRVHALQWDGRIILHGQMSPCDLNIVAEPDVAIAGQFEVTALAGRGGEKSVFQRGKAERPFFGQKRLDTTYVIKCVRI